MLWYLKTTSNLSIIDLMLKGEIMCDYTTIKTKMWVLIGKNFSPIGKSINIIRKSRSVFHLECNIQLTKSRITDKESVSRVLSICQKFSW